jgi:hypothetical protein
MQCLTYHDHCRLPDAGLLNLIGDSRHCAAQHLLCRLSGIRDDDNRTIRPIRRYQVGADLPNPAYSQVDDHGGSSLGQISQRFRLWDCG